MRRLGLPPAIWLALFVGVPVVLLLVMSFSPITYTGRMLFWPPTFQNFRETLSPLYYSAFLRTLVLATMTTAMTLVLSLPLAFCLCLLSPTRRLFCILFLSLPFFTNFLVRVYAWYILLRPDGVIGQAFSFFWPEQSLLNTNTAVVVGLTYVYLPFMLLPLVNAMERIDKNQLDAARDLGAKWWQVVWRVILPLSRRGILAGTTLVMIPCLGEMLIQRILGGGLNAMLGNVIEDSFLGKTRPNWPKGSALSLILVILVLGLLAILRSLEGKRDALS